MFMNLWKPYQEFAETMQKAYDPLSLMKETYEHMEKNLSPWMDEEMKKDSYAEWAGQQLNSLLFYQERWNQFNETVAKQFNIATKNDLARVSQLVLNVEEKLDNLEDRMDEWDTMKQDMEIIHRKMDHLIRLLEKGE